MGNSAEHNNVIQDRFPEKRQEQLGLRTNTEKIILYLQGKLGKAKLSPAMEERLNRMKQTSELITKYGGIKKVLPILCERFGISFPSARRLYRDSQDAYGSITHFNRQYHIDTYIGMVMEGINLAKGAGDFKAYAKLLELHKEAIEKFMGTNEAEMYRKIQPPDFRIGVFPEELKLKADPNWKSKIEKLKQDKYNDIEEAIVLEPEHEEDPL